MSFRPLSLRWMGFHADTPAAGDTLPARLTTPPRAWDYGAGTEPIASDAEDAVLRLRVRCEAGCVGLSVMTVNYGAMLIGEPHLRPQDGDRTVVFALPSLLGDCRLAARTYGEELARGELVVLSAEIGRRSDLDAVEALALYGPADAFPPPLDSDDIAWAPTRDERFLPLGLGNTCEAKFQIARVMQFRHDPETSEIGFRLAMLPPRRSEDRFGWELFDWQGTSLKAVLAYLRRDFQGVFERADLFVQDDAVLHRELRTFHEHDFEALLDDPRAKVSEAVIDRGYGPARARFDAMAARFRDIQLRPGPYLYVHVCEDIPGDWAIYELVTALRARSPDHRFRLLFVGYEDSDTRWGGYAHAVADKALRPRTWEKPLGREWEGPDEAWDRALAPYRLAFPDGSPAEGPPPG